MRAAREIDRPRSPRRRPARERAAAAQAAAWRASGHITGERGEEPKTLVETPISRELQAWRHQHNMSRQAIADALGVTYHTVRNWLYRGVRPEPWRARALARLMGMPESRLYALILPPPPPPRQQARGPALVLEVPLLSAAEVDAQAWGNFYTYLDATFPPSVAEALKRTAQAVQGATGSEGTQQ